MKKTGFFCLFLCLILLICPVLVTAETDVTSDTQLNTAVTQGCHTLDARYALLGSGQLVENVKAAIVYDIHSQTLLYAWNPDEAMDPASLVKIMTAWIAVEEGVLTDAVTVTQEVLDTLPEGAANAELVADEVLTVQDLLYCMMVDSANDAAAVLAHHVAGSQEAFVQKMNEKAAELGCTGTVFKNVHGLYAQQQHTTARDVARILSAAMGNESFAEIFETVDCTIPATNKSEPRYLVTGNYLLSSHDVQIYFDERVTGGRTGTANDGTRCLATVSEGSGMELVSVAMGSKSTYRDDGYTVHSFGGYNETRALLDAVYNGYVGAQVLCSGQVVQQRSVVDGDCDVSLGSLVSVSTVLPTAVTLDQLSLRYTDTAEEMRAPIKKGDRLSYIEIWYGNLCVSQADLFAMNSVRNSGSIIEQQDGPGVNWGAVAIVLAVVIACAAVAYFVLRLKGRFKRFKIQRRSKNYRASRRRSR